MEGKVLESKTVWLKAYLNDGVPGPEHFDIRKTSVDCSEAELGENEIVVQVMAMSVDPYLRGGLKNSAKKDDSGEKVMAGFITGRVVASKNSKYVAGDLIGGSLPFSTVQKVTDKQLGGCFKLTGALTKDNISLGVGVMGMPGSTAYGGLVDVLRPEKGQILFVSAAAGAVGSLVGQIAKNVYGCTIIGSCGGKEKCDFIKAQYGFDHAIDYKSLTGTEDEKRDQLIAKLKEIAPKGIDMYFENVGGIHCEAAFAALGKGGRIAVCGGISKYNQKDPVPEKLNVSQMIYQFQRIEGFMCAPWLFGGKGNFFKDMPVWIKEGKVKPYETFFEGVEQWPAAFQSLFTGKKKGKVVVRI